MTRVPQDPRGPIKPAGKNVDTLIHGGGQLLEELWSENPEA